MENEIEFGGPLYCV